MRQRRDDPLPVRLYRRALGILPTEFRRRYAAAMVAMLADEWRERRGLTRGALLAQALLDLLRTAVMERVSGSGGRHQKKPDIRPSKAGVSWLDVKLGLRLLVKHPGLTLIGGFGLAVGIAISVGFSSLTTAFFYPTLPLDEGERVIALENRDIAINDEERRSLHDFFTWRDEIESVEDLTAFRTVERNLIMGGGPPELVYVAEMTASGFELARVPPLFGRYLLAGDERESAPRVLVIGYHVWQNRFAGDSAVIGRTVRLGRAVHTIVGVMPEGFAFPESHDFWAALRERPSAYERREGPAIFIAGRLAPGITMKRAQAELSAIGERTAAAYPETHERLRPMVMPYTHSLIGAQGSTIWMVIQMNLMVSLVLLAIAMNVAVLIYARTAARQGEIAVRNALGASRGRLVTQLFVEALVLSAGAAALGIAIADVGIGMAVPMMEPETGVAFWMDYGLRPGTVLFTLAVAILVAVIVGVLPALQATGRRLQSSLRQLHGTEMRLGRTWTLLIAAQIAIAVAALPAAVNLGWNEIPGGLTHLTFPTEELAAASLAPDSPLGAPTSDVGRPAESVPFDVHLTELLRRLEAEPTVAGATFMAGTGLWFPRARVPNREGLIRVDGASPPPEFPAGHPVASIGVRPNFPAVLGLRILSGRSLESGDVGEGGSAVIVTEAFVREVLGGGEAIGRRIRHVSQRELAGESVPMRWYEIVGVVQDVATNPVMTPMVIRPAVYYPVDAEQVQQASLRVRLRGSTPADFAPRFRQIAAEVDPSLRLGPVRPLADLEREWELQSGLVALIVGLVLLSALLLSGAGVYAMMSFTVTQRRREIGVRSALGARPRQLLWSVFARAARQIAVGLGIGVALAVVVERLSGGWLANGRGAVFIPAVAITVAVVGVIAALGPARRGLKIQPTEALREE